MTRIALGLWGCPGKRAYIFRVGGAVAVTIDIVANLGSLVVGRIRSVIDIPLRSDFDILCPIDMACIILDRTGSIDRVVVAIIARVFSDPLRSDQAMVTV